MNSQIQLISNSFARFVGIDLLPLISEETNLERAFKQTSAVILSHGIEPDPLFNYGNPAALKLFELEWNDFVKLPSRYSAEPLERESRQNMLDSVNRHGFIDDYRGIRVSSTGKRFRIDSAYVWSLVNASGDNCGQAAMFDKWERIG